MFDQIDPRSPVPLYEQIAARIRVAVAGEELQPGDALPSVRQLAATLRVNPSTVVQAYRDLEREGYVELRQGAGTFVQALSAGLRSRERSRLARQLVRALVSDAAKLGLSPREVQQALDEEIGAKVR